MSALKLSLFTALFTAASLSYAGSIYSTGFESPDITGALSGQDGWQVFNPGASFDNVENAFVDTGSQAAWIGPTGSAQTGIYHTDTASGSPLIDLNADIYLFSSSTESQWQFAALGAGLAPFIGGVDLVPTAGPTDNIFAITQGFPTVGTFSLNAWHNLDFLFNFNTQTYNISLDGIVLASNLAFCTDNGPCTTGGTISEGQFLSFFDVFAEINANDLGVMDNLSLSAVPEPATYGLTGLALLTGALLRRRR
jgi:hypothetical protein